VFTRTLRGLHRIFQDLTKHYASPSPTSVPKLPYRDKLTPTMIALAKPMKPTTANAVSN